MKKGATASKGKKGAKEEAAVELPPPPPPQDEPPPVEVVIERKPVDRTFLTEKLNLDRINRVDKVLKKTYSVPALKKDPNVEEKKVEGDPGLSDNNGGSLLPESPTKPLSAAESENRPTTPGIVIDNLTAAKSSRPETPLIVPETENISENIIEPENNQLKASKKHHHSARELFRSVDASLVVNKPPTKAEIDLEAENTSLLMPADLQAALDLRERRITRRRNRALGVPPDPNDSDDSLLAEINEATDDKLFPGFQFGKKGSKPVLQSTHPVRLNISQIKKKLKDHIKYTESNSSITKDSDEAAFLLSHPKEVLDSFTPKTLKTFEGLVIQKYYKNGAITGFKGKDEIQTIKLKTMARNEIEDIKTNAISTENNLIELKNHLNECRANVSTHTAECINLIKKINHIVETEKPLKIDPHLANPKLPKQINENDPLNYQLPKAPHLQQNKKFRELAKSYVESSSIAKDSIAAIPHLEAEIVPVEHHFNILQIQLDRLHSLNQDILESDMIDALESYIVGKLKKVEEKHRKERKRLAQLVIDEATEAAARKRKSSMQPVFFKEEAVTDESPSKLVLPDINKRREQEPEGEIEIRKRNLQSLKARVAKIRKAIAERAVVHDPKGSEKAELFLADGEVDLSESAAVRETRRAIIARKIENKKLEIEMNKEQQLSKMLILKKLLDVDDLERKEHDQWKSKQDLQKALESLAPRPLAAFPIQNDPVQAQQLRTKLHERASPSPQMIQRMEALFDESKEDELTNIQDNNSKQSKKPLPAPKHKLEVKIPKELHAKIDSPFMPEPSSVVFKDYEPEKTYTKKVKITNTSCRVNTFKMRPLSIELATFFDVIAPPPGRMSAGMECEVVFNFRPPTGYNQDIIDGIVEFEAEVGGLFVVRLGCSSKTCKPRISSVGGPGIGTIKLEKSLTDKIKSENESRKRVCELTGESEILVNFGACVQGGQAQRNVEIHNDGAIESEVEIAKLDGSTDNSFYITNGSTPVKLAGYASLTLCLLFQPSKLSSATEAEDISSLAAFNVKFNRPGVNPITIKCQGEILKSPLRIDRSFLDFGISVVESVYREQVLVTNHSNVAIKYWIEIDGMTLRSQFNTANKSSRGIGNNDKNLDYGSDICTDGIDSDNGDNDYGQTRLNFFSEDDLGSGSVVNMSPEAVGGLNVPALPERPNSNSLLLPAIGMGFGSTMGVMSRQVSYLASDDQQFSIRPLKRTGRNPAAISKRSDNLEVEVQNMGELEIAPKLAVIQPFETSKIWFKIKPSRSGHILLKNGENPYSVFVRIKYMNQGVETPMPVSITGRVTTSDMSFSVPGKVGRELIFNDCTLSEAKEIPIKISNNSRIPQKVRFNSSDPSIMVLFKDKVDINGTVPIEPLSHEIRMVRFEPLDSGSVKARLSCHSIWNRNFELKCSGTGIKTLLTFDYSELRFGAIGLGSSKTTNIKIRSLGSKTTSFGSSLNLAMISSVVKQTWASDESTSTKLKTNGLNNKQNNEDLVQFEFGNPKIIGIYKRSQLETSFQIKEQMNETTSRLICEEAESAVERTDPTLLKTFRPSIRKSSNTPEFNPVDTDPEVVFASGEPVHSNPRILVPLDVEAVADSFDQKLASISFEDPLLVSMYPRKGTLGPGEDLDIGVKLSIPEISKLAVSNIIQEKMKLEEEEAKTAIESVPAAVVPDPVERRQSIQPEKKDDVPKSAKKKEKGAVNPVAAVSAVTEVEATIIPPEPVVYSIFDKTTSEDTNATDSQATKLKMAEIYHRLDDTCITVLVPCKIERHIAGKPKKDSPPLQSDDALNLVGSKVRKPKNTSDVIYLRLIAPVVSPDLILLDPLTSVLDFGTTPLHKQEIRQFVVYNRSNKEVILNNSKSLDKTGPFKLITELNQIVPPQSKTSVQILFEPHEELTYTSKFDVCSLTSQVEVKLVGQGVIPSIRVDPENTDLFLGDVVVGDTTTKVFKVFNTSYFPLSCQVSLCPSTHGTTNFSNSNAFSVSPWHARIEPNQFQEFVIKFYPDRESDVYFDTVTIYPNGSPHATQFQIHGRCWDTSSVLLGYDRPPVELHEYGHTKPTTVELEYAQKLYYGEFARPPPVSQKEEDDDIEVDTPTFNSNLSISGNTIKAPQESKAATGSTSKLNVDAKKKGGSPSTKDSKNAPGKQDIEDTTAEVLRFTNRVQHRFVTLSCPWKQKEGSGQWYVDSKGLTLSSIKSATFVKPETKRPPNTEYIIEAWNGSFEYSDEYHGYKVQHMSTAKSESIVRFTIESLKGTIEFGTQKDIPVKLINPAFTFSESISSLKKRVLVDKKGAEELKEEESQVLYFDTPIPVETYFKITLKGGYRYTDPKGLVSLSESRIWFVKVITQ